MWPAAEIRIGRYGQEPVEEGMLLLVAPLELADEGCLQKSVVGQLTRRYALGYFEIGSEAVFAFADTLQGLGEPETGLLGQGRFQLLL